MTLEALSYISQIASAVVIVASLAAVYWQMRQTNMIARAELTLNAHLQNGMIHRELADTPEKAELMVRLLSQTTPLTPAEIVQIKNIVGIAIGAHEALFTLRIRIV